MIKIIKESIVYYIRDVVAQGITINLNQPYGLLRVADMAIDTNTFRLLKYRYEVASRMRVVNTPDRVYYLDNDTVLDCYVDLHDIRDVTQHADVVIDKETFDVLKSRSTDILSYVA